MAETKDEVSVCVFLFQSFHLHEAKASHHVLISISVAIHLFYRGRCDACLAFLGLQLAGVGLVASIASSVICNYFTVSSLDNDSTTQLGVWMMSSANETTALLECTPYPSGTPIDALFKTARAMTILSPIVCFVGMGMSYFSERGGIRREGLLFGSIFVLLCAAAMQGLTLMALESDVCINNPLIEGDGNCGRSYGANLSIGAASFMAAGVFALLVTGGAQKEM